MPTSSEDSKAYARNIRSEIVRATHRARASHTGGALSIADILAVLYGGVLRVRPEQPDWADRDRLVLSKGHCCTALYAALALRGFFPLEELLEYGQDGSRMMNHVSHHVPGVEFSTGSLGHGLPFATGRALAGKRRNTDWNVYCIVSDGELDEGSNWEAILFGGHHRLGRLCLIVDYNRIQSFGRVEEVLNLDPLAAKFQAFGWETVDVDGHDHEALHAVLGEVPHRSWDAPPLCLVANTVKGKGVRAMEDQLLFHYRNPDDALLDEALRDINGTA